MTSGERRKTREATTVAVRQGKIVKSESCERCGTVGYTECHHPDYSDHLNVEWLCKPCHKEETRLTGGAGRPPIYDEPMTTRFEVRFPSHLMAEIRRQARKLGVQPGTAARLMLKTVMDSGKDLELGKPDGVAKGGN